MKYPKMLYIPKGVGELIYGAVDSEDHNLYWHLFCDGGSGKHTFCSLSFEMIEDLTVQFGLSSTYKKSGYINCPDCIKTIVDLKRKLNRINKERK